MAPEGLEPNVVEADGPRSSLGYARADSLADAFDAELWIHVDTAGHLDPAAPGATETMVHGWPAVAAPLRDDGRVYGVQVSFVDDLGRLVNVTWAVLGADVVGAAEHLVALDAPTWGRWRRALSMDNRANLVSDDAVEVRVDAPPGVLVALVPPDFPLISEDRRRTCAAFELDGVRHEATCGTWPVWLRGADGNVYVYGVADPSVTSVTARPAPVEPPPSDPTPVTVAVHLEPGWPGGVYMLTLPHDWCQLVVDGGGPNGTPAPTGQIGVPSAAC